MKRTWITFIIVAVLGIALDQSTKLWIVANLDYRTGHVDIIPHFFQLVHAQNPGAAFGSFGNMPAPVRVGIFLTFTVLAIGVILDMLRKLPDNDRFMSVVLGMIFSGAVGNAIDRIHKQSVTDFLRFYTDNPEWVTWLRGYNLAPEYPSFNIADVSLVVGVLLFMVHMFMEKDEPEAASAENEDSGEPNGVEA